MESFSQIFEKRLTEFEKELSSVDKIVQSPALFISDHFFAIRNEIDIQAETIIAELSGLDAVPSHMLLKDNQERPIDKANDLNKAEVNEIRKSMIDELCMREKALISSLKSRETPQIGKDIFHEKVAAIRGQLQAMKPDESQGLNEFYQALVKLGAIESELDAISNKLKSELLMGSTVFYWKKFLNQLGVLAIVKDEFLGDLEFAKTMTILDSEMLINFSLLKDLLEKRKARIDKTNYNISISQSFLILNYFGAFVSDLLSYYKEQKPDQKLTAVLELTKENLLSISTDIKYSTSQRLRSFNMNPSIAVIGSIDQEAFSITPNMRVIQLPAHKIREIKSGSFKYLSLLEILDLSNNKLETIDANAFEALNSLKLLNLSTNRLKQLDVSFFNGMAKLETIFLSENQLDLAEGSATSLAFSQASSIKTLYLSRNRISTLPSRVFGKMVNLMVLYMEVNDLNALDTSPFEMTTSDVSLLSYLNLESNKISKISSAFFVGLNNLRNLRLVKNCIECLSENTFSGLKFLQNLDLSKNRLGKIETCTFAGLERLTVLDLSDNFISELVADSFKSLVMLESLNLSKNRLARIEANVFTDLKSLKSLHLNSNEICHIAEDAFDDLTRLDFIGLSVNQLTSIGVNIFSKLSGLKNLYMNENPINHIDEQAFANLNSLEICSFEFCHIGTINAKIFQGANSCSNIRLNNNQLERLDEFFSVNLASLTILKLDSNKIKHIHENSFNCLFNLVELRLSKNLIEELGVNVFSSLTKLKSLDLNNNKLKALKPGLFSRLTSVNSIGLMGNKIECLEPDSFVDLPLLETLDLDMNPLSVLGEGCFKNLKSLKYLNLNETQLESISNSSFSEELKSVEVLSCMTNRINSIDEKVLENLKYLYSLHLTGNRLKFLNFAALHSLTLFSVESNRFESLTAANFTPENRTRHFQMKTAIIRDCLVKTIDYDAFNFVRSIELLDLSGNKLKDIDITVLKPLERLSKLNLSTNNLTSLSIETNLQMPRITHLTLENNKISKIRKNFFTAFPNIQEINLKNNSIRKLSDVFSPNNTNSDVTSGFSNFSELNLAHNLIDSLAEFSLASFFERLSILSLASNRIERIQESDFKQLKSLLNLNLASNKIKSLEGNVFEHLTMLKKLDLSYNQLSKLTDNTVFSTLSSLTHLDLSFNQLEQINFDAFSNLIKLEDIDFKCNQLTNENFGSAIPYFFRNCAVLKNIQLSSNKLTLVDDYMFSFLEFQINKSLKVLNLSNNSIRSVSQNAFSNLVSLNYLDLSNNQIEQMGDDVFDQLVSLNKLDLSRNQLSTVNFLSKKMKSLQKINLEQNKLADFPPDQIWMLRNIDELILSRNQLKHIGTRFFSVDRLRQYDFLDRLDFSNNLIENIEPNAFENLQCLTNLTLSNNKLNKLPRECFRGLMSLRDLNLNDNPLGPFLDDPPEELFSQLTKLEILGLKNVGVKSISDRLLASLPGTLIKLILSGNQITVLKGRVFNNNLKSLQQFYIDNNRLSFVEANVFKQLNKLRELYLECNPDLHHIDLSDVTINLFKINLSQTGLQELKGNMFSATPYLTELDLSKNQISTISENTFDGLKCLTYLNLSFNQLHQVDVCLLANKSLKSQLVKLVLAGNKLQSINLDLLADFSHLESLDISQNHIDRFPLDLCNPIADSLQLTDINLSSNKLSDLQEIVKFLKVNNNENLIKLNFANNEIESIDDELLFNEKFCRLKSLNLSNNKIKTIRANTFNPNNLISLVEINLSNNKLSDLNLKETGLSQLYLLEHLNLVNNAISVVTTSDLAELNSLKALSFDGQLEQATVSQRHEHSLYLINFDDAIDENFSLVTNKQLDTKTMYLTERFFKSIDPVTGLMDGF